jgi:hypothetical protein
MIGPVRRRHLAYLLTAVLLAACAAPGTGVGDGDSSGLRSPAPSGSAPPAPRPSAPASAPADPAACPASGVRIETDGRDAATGLRLLGLSMVNCGRTTYRVNGYPVLRALDEDRAGLDIKVLRGVDEIAGALPGWTGKPAAVVLKPGQRAGAVVVWRNTYDDITDPPVSAPYLEVAPAAGRPATVLTPDPLDLGSTGRLGVSPWRFSKTPG